jgi:hypothetical protein
MYGLHPLMLTKYTLPLFNGGPWDPNLIRVLMNHLYEFEKLQEYKMEVQENIIEAQWNRCLWLQHGPKKTFRFGDYMLWFPKEPKEKVGKFNNIGMEFTIYNIVFFIALYHSYHWGTLNFEPHPIL